MDDELPSPVNLFYPFLVRENIRNQMNGKMHIKKIRKKYIFFSDIWCMEDDWLTSHRRVPLSLQIYHEG